MNTSLTGNDTMKLQTGNGGSLEVIFGAVASALTVAALAATVIAIACKTRRKRAKPYYSITKTFVVQPRNSKHTGTDSLGSTTAVLDQRQEELLSRSMVGQESMELTETQESIMSAHEQGQEPQAKEVESAVSLPPLSNQPLPIIQVNEAPEPEVEHERRRFERRRYSVPIKQPNYDESELIGGSERDKRKSEQFAFEDGTPLEDYPASIDLEVAGKDDEMKKANIMGYPDIYNSHILLTVNEEDPQKDIGTKKPFRGERGEQPPQEGAELGRAINSSRGVSGEANVLERKRRVSAPQPTRVAAPSLTPELKDVEEFLNKSMTDLLQMTAAMAEEVGLEEDRETSRQEPRGLRRQGSSLPTLLETHQDPQELGTADAPPPRHLTHFQRNVLLPASSACPSVRASRGSTIDFSDLEDLTPEMRRVLISSDDFTGMEISHV